MNQPASLSPTPPIVLTPNAELAADITYALREAGLINEDDAA